MTRTLRVGSRGSDLALVQARWVMSLLGDETELTIIETHGDRVTDRPLNEVGGTGLFIKEIESALLEERIDVAVHSMKDVPSVVPDGLTLAATTERLDARDALISRSGESIDELPAGAHVATGSLRRRSQLLAARPDLIVEDLRGNVPTRLAKFDDSSWAAIVLAAAGLRRLGLDDRIRSLIPTDVMVPAVGQGALAIETRVDDRETVARVRALNHRATERAVAAERTFLARLEGGCQVPIGAHGQIEADQLRLTGFVGAIDGTRSVKKRQSAPQDDAEALGLALAGEMIAEGADEIVREVERGA